MLSQVQAPRPAQHMGVPQRHLFKVCAPCAPHGQSASVASAVHSTPPQHAALRLPLHQRALQCKTVAGQGVRVAASAPAGAQSPAQVSNSATAGIVLQQLEKSTSSKSSLDALYQQCEPMRCHELIGHWRGYLLPHAPAIFAALFKALSRAVWYGKHFVSVDSVQAAVLRVGGLRFGVPYFGAARLRDMQHAGEQTAAMQYKHLPMVDYMRKADNDTVLGVWTVMGRFVAYFVLTRAGNNE